MKTRAVVEHILLDVITWFQLCKQSEHILNIFINQYMMKQMFEKEPSGTWARVHIYISAIQLSYGLCNSKIKPKYLGGKTLSL